MENERQAMPESDRTVNNEIRGSEGQDVEGSTSVPEEVPPSSSHRTSPVLFIGPLANPALAVERYTPRDVKDPMAVNGSCGLYNLGNTCFMNAGLQSLASCGLLLKFFFEEFQATDSLRGSLTSGFYQLIAKMWSGRYSLVHPRPFKELLGLYHPQFQDFRQHDCQEFLALLLDTFHEQLNQVSLNIALTTPTTQPVTTPSTSIDTQGPGHLNNEELAESGSTEKKESFLTSPADISTKLVCPETLASEEELMGADNSMDVSPRSSQGQNSLSAESGGGRSSLKRVSSSPTEAVMAALISEDSNHSTVSAHSTDSEQSSAFKKLKIESDSANGSMSVLSSVSELSTQESSQTETCAVSTTAAGAGNQDNSVSDNNNSAESGVNSMEMSPPSQTTIPQRKCVRLDIPSQSQGNPVMPAAIKTNREQNVEVSSDTVNSVKEGDSSGVLHKKFNNTDLPSASSDVLSAGQTCHGEGPGMTSSPQEGPQTNPLHFYCKETKTLNTNVLVSNFTPNDVTMDSEKFAKVDNRSQVPVTKEVNLLQEALHGLEEDKVDKVLIGKTLNSTTTTSLITTATSSEEKSNPASNLRTVKMRQPSAILCKTAVDPNLLNNSYEYEDEVLVGYGSLVSSSLNKPGPEGLQCVKGALTGEISSGSDKLELGGSVAVDLVSCEVEKNVQMQALTKLKNTITKSNIREDISDKASTSGSTETEDGDMEMEGEESSASDEEGEETPSRGSVTGDNSVSLPNPARCFTTADVTAANAAWECYKSRNNSVIVDTFQGQFKSTVVCSECDNVSVTYEPFMYLSLPIPYAMERQICVVYVRPHKSTVRYMLTLHKNDKVQRLRNALQTMTSTENTDVIIAEVLDNHISRILDENIMLRYVNDSMRIIYAFQMLPPPEMPPEPSLAQDDPSCFSPQDQNIPSPQSTAQHTPNTILEPCTETLIQPLSIDVSGGDSAFPHRSPSPLLSMDAMLNEAQRSRSPSASGAATTLNEGESDSEGNSKLDGGDKYFGDSDDAQAPPGADPMLMGTGMWEWNNRDEFLHDPVPHVSAPPTSPTSQHSGTFAPTDLNLNVDYSSEALFPQSPSSMDVEMDHIPSASELANSQMWPGPEEVGDKGGGDAGGGASGLMDQWQTCAICLEELMDSHLLTHEACKGVFCHSCLEMSAKHSGDLANGCPVCLCPVDVTQDFVPLVSGPAFKSKVRILAVALTFRCGRPRCGGEEGGEGEEMRLVCGPRLTYLASQQDGNQLYTLVDKVVPFVESYSLHFTDGQGLRCSRCDYSAHCTGCMVAREGEVILQPGDNLTVHFTEDIPSEEVEAKMHVSDDESLQRLRSSDPISIYDCFDAFTQSEVLDEHNPWYCPCCERNQCAKKTMTVWRYPDNLIIHLKRFVYEDLSSNKIDSRVVFPHTSLDVTRFLAGPSTSFNVYDVYSIVCHYGGANSGHYTAFSCHPMTSEWYYYNDETVTQQKPGDSEFDSSYILFFRRQGPQVQFELVKDSAQQEEEDADFTSSPSLLLPSPSPASQQSTSAVITFHTEGFTVTDNNATTVTAATSEVDNIHNYDFYN